ncbi:efflux RND transporter periplasmic adaptor subunit [Roseomonas sp. CCTCC AB2023176]|uniref:efflux RND transporter periplasmic adaptor subunit n=1 Tax=Roseomonas sp. CCTCC AB2023176 TaxID=3342640 RepID=UPI0035E07392
MRPPARLAAASLLMVLTGAVPALAQFGPQGPPAVGVQQAARRPVTEQSEFVGRVEAVERVDLRARVTGFLQEVVFREGQEVRRGEVLYRIERQTFEAEVARQQAQIASAEASLANARETLGRAQELVRSGAGTRATLDNAVAQERTANANLLAARAALRGSDINLGYTDITAPISGKIGRTNRTVGNVVGPDAGTLATIVSQDPMRVSFPVSQRQALELRDRYAARGGVEAVQVRIRLTDGRTYPQAGRIEFVDNQIDRSTDTILVRALMPNPPLPTTTFGDVPDRALIDGQFVSVFVEGLEPVLAIGLPRSAVLQDQQGSYVFIVDNESKAQRRNVRLGRSTAETAIIESGLEQGENVIVEGIQRVRPGQQVNAAPAGAPPVRPPGAPGAAPAAGAPNASAAGGGAGGRPARPARGRRRARADRRRARRPQPMPARRGRQRPPRRTRRRANPPVPHPARRANRP